MRFGKLAVGAAVLLMAACTVEAAPVRNDGAPETLRWHPCAGKGWPGDARCATLRVPLDHRRPDGPTLDVAVSRVPAADRAHRRGVLVTNPGGPGSPGLRSAIEYAGIAAPKVRAAFDRYDLVSFDPRGVGASEAVACGLNKEQILQLKAPIPRRAGVASAAPIARASAEACAGRGDDTLRTVSTENTARDLDLLRQALGEERISYYGNSYGTYLGTVYSTLFGEHTDRVVLDSMVDSEHGWYEQNRLTARATEKRFDDFATWRVRRGDADSVAEERARYRQLAGALERRPARAGEFTVDGRLLRRLTYVSVGKNDSFSALGATLDCLARPDGDPCRDSVATVLRALLNSPELADATASAYLAVQCNDSAAPRDPRTYRRNVAADARRFPITGGGFADASACAYWPYRSGPPVRASRTGPDNILLLNNTRDRISDYGGALSTRRALGERARLVTVQGWNHNVLSNGNACADAHLARWLGAGELPGADRFCAERP